MTLFRRLFTARPVLLSAAALLATLPAAAQQKTAVEAPKGPDHSASYYHYSLAHMYEEMAVNQGRTDYATQAIEEYKLALNADPDSAQLQDGLADLYLKLGRVREAVSVAQEQVKRNPNDVEAHNILGRIYLRSLGDGTPNGQSQQMLQMALTEYQAIVRLKPDSVEDHLLLGQLYALNRENDKAEAELKTAQKLDGTSEEVVLAMVRLYGEQNQYDRIVQLINALPVTDRTARMEYSLALTYDQLKKPKEAAAAYQRSLDIDNDNLDAQRGLASALLLDGQFDAALKQYKDIVAAEPQDAQSYIRIAEIQRRQGHYEEALATLKKAKTLVTDSLELSYNEALLYDSLGRFDDAVTTLNKLLTDTAHADGNYTDGEKNNRVLFLDRLGTVLREQGKTAQAVDAYKQIVALGGDNIARGYQGEVDAYRDNHDWAKMTAAAGEAAKALPKEKGVQMLYAGTLADTGKVEEAITIAKAQLGGDDDRDIRMQLAQMYIRLKRWKDADEQLTKVEGITSRNEDKIYLHFSRGTLAERQKLYDQAEAEFRKVLAIDPNNAATLNYLGYMLADRGQKLPEAVDMVRKAVELDPQNGAYLDSLGWAYFKSGQYALAEENLLKAKDRITTDPTVYDHLGELYEQTGKLKQAVSWWERSMKEYKLALAPDADPADQAKVQKKLDNARVKLARATPAARSAVQNK
ncbi:tetratricopeptide repeat protein [Terriglobus tenax]|uniref:tetratricopeptide repeat protein n=1 Tax=Terriglobus tenax TaxID=1111115 RepID=UPI0021E06A2D|nr:tetratricopeptide repeat protein [Terriglobus tenax]